MIYTITTLAADKGGDLSQLDPVANSISTVQVASLLIGVFIPILVGLVTKRTTNASVKSLLLLALSAVSGFLTEFVNSANFVWQQALLTSVITFVIGVATYYGLWTPTGVTAKAQAVGSGNQGGYGALWTIGVVLVVIGVILLVLALAGAVGVGWLLPVLTIVVGIVCIVLGSRAPTV